MVAFEEVGVIDDEAHWGSVGFGYFFLPEDGWVEPEVFHGFFDDLSNLSSIGCGRILPRSALHLFMYLS